MKQIIREEIEYKGISVLIPRQWVYPNISKKEKAAK